MCVGGSPFWGAVRNMGSLARPSCELSSDAAGTRRLLQGQGESGPLYFCRAESQPEECVPLPSLWPVVRPRLGLVKSQVHLMALTDAKKRA